MSLLLKFGILFVRTIAKPVSNTIKNTVKDYPTFRRIAISGARLYAKTNARWDRLVQRRPIVDKKGHPIQRRELTETEALDQAADFMGEAFLFGVGAWALWFQQNRSGGKEKEKEQRQEDRWAEELPKTGRLSLKVLKLEQEYQEIQQELAGIRIFLALKFRDIGMDLMLEDLYSLHQVWEVMSVDDAKLGGRREPPRIKSAWEEEWLKLNHEYQPAPVDKSPVGVQ